MRKYINLDDYCKNDCKCNDMMCTCWNDYLPTEPDDFCSYGERKED